MDMDDERLIVWRQSDGFEREGRVDVCGAFWLKDSTFRKLGTSSREPLDRWLSLSSLENPLEPSGLRAISDIKVILRLATHSSLSQEATRDPNTTALWEK